MEPELSRAALYATVSALIVPLTEAIKRLLPSSWDPDRYAPLVALLFGLLAAFGVVSAVPVPPQPVFVTVVIGLGMGLGAAGLYSGTRSVVLGK